MKTITCWTVLLTACVSASATGQDSSEVKALKARVTTLEAELANLRAELAALRELLLTPKLVLQGSQEYEVRGKVFTRYRLAVENHAVFPKEMFRAAPDLPPCGKNRNSSRTWVDIMNSDGKRVYGFCAFNSPENLTSLWFAVPKDGTPPAGVYIVLNDRENGVKLKSNTVTIEKNRSEKDAQ